MLKSATIALAFIAALASPARAHEGGCGESLEICTEALADCTFHTCPVCPTLDAPTLDAAPSGLHVQECQHYNPDRSGGFNCVVSDGVSVLTCHRFGTDKHGVPYVVKCKGSVSK